MWLKFLLFILIIYFGVKLIKNLLRSAPKHREVKGTPQKNEPLDLSKYDVEDADFEEIDE